MSVDLNTSELGFKRPFTREVTQVLRLKNPNHGPVVFKVKTTAPKQYCVRPNHGRIEAGKEVEVQVLLQAMKEDLPLDVRSKDKFLVQSVAITAEQEFDNMTEVWQQVEKLAKSSIHEKKIRVNFLAADAESNGSTRTSLAPPPYSSPPLDSANPETPSKTPLEDSPMKTPAMGRDSPVVSSPEAPKALDVKQEEEKVSAPVGEAPSATQELRQRKPVVAAAASVASHAKDTLKSGNLALQHAQPEGVPVNIVFILCLISFLIGYLFF